jgi:hypothetical protein
MASPVESLSRSVMRTLCSAQGTVGCRIALDEVLHRFPEWEIDLEQARRTPTTTVRGWDSMPAVIG